jgi:hypothetical protein
MSQPINSSKHINHGSNSNPPPITQSQHKTCLFTLSNKPTLLSNKRHPKTHRNINITSVEHYRYSIEIINNRTTTLDNTTNNWKHVPPTITCITLRITPTQCNTNKRSVDNTKNKHGIIYTNLELEHPTNRNNQQQTNQTPKIQPPSEIQLPTHTRTKSRIYFNTHGTSEHIQPTYTSLTKFTPLYTSGKITTKRINYRTRNLSTSIIQDNKPKYLVIFTVVTNYAFLTNRYRYNDAYRRYLRNPAGKPHNAKKSAVLRLENGGNQ